MVIWWPFPALLAYNTRFCDTASRDPTLFFSPSKKSITKASGPLDNAAGPFRSSVIAAVFRNRLSSLATMQLMDAHTLVDSGPDPRDGSASNSLSNDSLVHPLFSISIPYPHSSFSVLIPNSHPQFSTSFLMLMTGICW